jgi:hypothetical protein
MLKYSPGTKVEKHFPGYGWFQGAIVSADDEYYMIEYEDGDREEMDESEVEMHLFSAGSRPNKKLARYGRKESSSSNRKSKWQKNDILWSTHGIDPDKCQFTNVDLPPKVLERLADFYLLIYERQRIWERRSLNEPQPWSQVPIFQNYSFCNVYRELDQGTRFFHTHVLALWDKQEHPVTEHSWTCTVLWAAYTYRLMNRVSTFEKVGFPQLHMVTEFLSQCQKVMDKEAIFTRAHQNCGWNKYQQGIKQVAAKNGVAIIGVVDMLLKASTVKECLVALQKLPNVGTFMSWQLWCDLTESRCLQSATKDLDSFCLLGPGAIKGLDLIFAGVFVRDDYLQLAQVVVECQESVFEGLGLIFPKWKGRALGLKEIEHGLCEYQKASCENLVKCARRAHDKSVLKSDSGQRRCDSCLALSYSTGILTADKEPMPLHKSPSWICSTCQKFDEVSF